jgi:hypothetical protein
MTAVKVNHSGRSRGPQDGAVRGIIHWEYKGRKGKEASTVICDETASQ